MYRKFCTADADSACSPCTNPTNGIYTGPGKDGDPKSCPATCKSGQFKVDFPQPIQAAVAKIKRCISIFYRKSSSSWLQAQDGTCKECSKGTCPNGMYRKLCSADADSTCAPCTNPPNGGYTGPGKDGDSASCPAGPEPAAEECNAATKKGGLFSSACEF